MIFDQFANHSTLKHILFLHPSKRVEEFLDLSEKEKIHVLNHSTLSVRRELLNHLPVADAVNILNKVEPDQATDWLQLMSGSKQQQVLEELSESLKGTLSDLLDFDPQTAAGLMTLDYILVDIDSDIMSVARKFKLHEQRTGRSPVILIVQEGHLIGTLPGHELGLNQPKDKISPLVKKIPTVRHNDSHEFVIDQFQAHPKGKLVVLDEEERVIGIIYSDDVLRIIHKKEASSLYDFAGISKEEAVTDVAKIKIRHRYKWLIINLFTAFMTATVVGMFESTLTKYVILAAYMPIVAGMGGNAATQTLAVSVRGIALKQIDLSTSWGVLKNELAAALFHGLLVGALIAVVVIVLSQDYLIALVLGLAMVVNLQVAAFFGTLVPLIMSKLGKDPAASASIFITTATDVLGFTAFLGLATLLLA